MSGERWFVVGGAGFIGSHFVDRLLADPEVGQVTIYDNYASGRHWHHAAHDADPRFSAVARRRRGHGRAARRPWTGTTP